MIPLLLLSSLAAQLPTLLEAARQQQLSYEALLEVRAQRAQERWEGNERPDCRPSDGQRGRCRACDLRAAKTRSSGDAID